MSEPLRSFRLPSAPVLAAILGLAVVLAVLAAGQDPIWTPRGVFGLDRRTIVTALIVLFSLGGIAGTAGVAFYHRARIRPAHPDRPLRDTLLRATPPLLVGLVVAGLWGISEGHLGGEIRHEAPEVSDARGRLGQRLQFIGGWDTPVVRNDAVELPDARNPFRSLPPGFVIYAFGALALATVAGIWLRAIRGARRPARGLEIRQPDEGRPDVEATRAVFVGMIESMLADPDPDTAVIGAYARLLQGLDAAGAPRRPHEGPMEHLRRVLRTLEVRAGPLEELVRLFGAARFSSLHLTPEDRARALRALEDVAEELSPARGAAR